MIRLDPSPRQIAAASQRKGVTYLCAPAESLPVADGSADLITAAQAVHWLDRPAFYTEARRVATPGAIIALISYGVLRLHEPSLSEHFARLYHDEIGRFWPAECKLVDAGYADIEFPFEELPKPELSIEKHWPLKELLGYISTWSAISRADEAGAGDIAGGFARDMTRIWGAPDTRRDILWQISMRLGRI